MICVREWISSQLVNFLKIDLNIWNDVLEVQKDLFIRTTVEIIFFLSFNKLFSLNFPKENI